MEKQLRMSPRTSGTTAALPIEFDGERLGLRLPLPRPGEHNREFLEDEK